MLLPPAHGQREQEWPLEWKGNPASSRPRWVHPSTSWAHSSPKTWASPHSRAEYKCPLSSTRSPHARTLSRGRLTTPQPFCIQPHLSRRRPGPRSFLWGAGPSPLPSGAHSREEHFPGGSPRPRELFVQKERSLYLTGNWEGRGERAGTRENTQPKTKECKGLRSSATRDCPLENNARGPVHTGARAQKQCTSWESHSLARTSARGNGINRLQPPLQNSPGAHTREAQPRGRVVHAQLQRTGAGVGGWQLLGEKIQKLQIPPVIHRKFQIGVS